MKSRRTGTYDDARRALPPLFGVECLGMAAILFRSSAARIFSLNILVNSHMEYKGKYG